MTKLDELVSFILSDELKDVKNYNCYTKLAAKAKGLQQEQVKNLTIPDFMPRYFVDERAGCAAVRDREHCKYDPTYQGLHRDTSDVIEYKHGRIEDGQWILDQDDLKHLYELCVKLNSIQRLV